MVAAMRPMGKEHKALTANASFLHRGWPTDTRSQGADGIEPRVYDCCEEQIVAFEATQQGGAASALDRRRP